MEWAALEGLAGLIDPAMPGETDQRVTALSSKSPKSV